MLTAMDSEIPHATAYRWLNILADNGDFQVWRVDPSKRRLQAPETFGLKNHMRAIIRQHGGRIEKKKLIEIIKDAKNRPRHIEAALKTPSFEITVRKQRKNRHTMAMRDIEMVIATDKTPAPEPTPPDEIPIPYYSTAYAHNSTPKPSWATLLNADALAAHQAAAPPQKQKQRRPAPEAKTTPPRPRSKSNAATAQAARDPAHHLSHVVLSMPQEIRVKDMVNTVAPFSPMVRGVLLPLLNQPHHNHELLEFPAPPPAAPAYSNFIAF